MVAKQAYFQVAAYFDINLELPVCHCPLIAPAVCTRSGYDRARVSPVWPAFQLPAPEAVDGRPQREPPPARPGRVPHGSLYSE
jgi:hypothetical protein